MASEQSQARTSASAVERITHGRHCTCSACAQEDWTRPELAPCGMHGASCPAGYVPLGAAGDTVPATVKHDWRAEMYGDEGGTDPFWVSVEDEHGDHRDAVAAAQLCKGFMGSFDDGLTVELIRGRVEYQHGWGGYWFTGDPEGDHSFWEVRHG